MSRDTSGQFRIDTVQVLNWGGYTSRQVMHVRRAGTAILGPSGGGKSTLLDAMASVIMPNPQEFNQAARDDKGKKRERTVYSYARGLTDRRRDGNRRSGTTTYLRPPGGQGFPSGAAITWSHEDGRRITVFRLAWVSTDIVDAQGINANTIYGLVHDHFNLERLHGLVGTRPGSSPLTRSTLEPLIDLSRGDLVHQSQVSIHARMRSAMSMGVSDESQRLAMQLLRRAQASKGIFNINALFKEFVLTEPRALERWETALDTYREASRLYDEFEDARRRLETLAPLPDLDERYRTAGQLFLAKQGMLTETPAGEPPRLQVWHAEKVYEWATKKCEDTVIALAELREDIQEAETKDSAAQREFEDAIHALTAAGGDPTQTLTLELKSLQEKQETLTAHRLRVAERLEEFGMVLPTSAGDLSLTTEGIKIIREEIVKQQRALDEGFHEAARTAGNLEARQREIAAELNSLAQRRSNIPPEADAVRVRISRATRVPLERLPYAGELLQIRAEHRGWEKAVAGVLGGLARDLVVARDDLSQVRAFVNDNTMGQLVTLTRADIDLPEVVAIPETVPTLLDIADSPYRGWLTRQLVQRFSYWCVERDTQLLESRPPGTIGTVTRAGMRTGAHNRFIKDDRHSRYNWIGWDTSQLFEDILREQTDLSVLLLQATSELDASQGWRDAGHDRLRRLDELTRELVWQAIDPGPLEHRITELARQIAEADTPEVKTLLVRMKQARQSATTTSSEVAHLYSQRTKLSRRHAALVDVQDTASSTLDDQSPLTPDERATLAESAAQLPHHVDDQDIERDLPRVIKASYLHAVEDLQAQMRRHEDMRRQVADTLLATIRAYRNIDERSAREIDETIEALPALLAIHEQLRTDDLPRAKNRWLKKVDQDMNTHLQGLLVQIEEDRRLIHRGLAPINTVLEKIAFRADSSLTIEVGDQPSPDLHDFRTTITRYTSDTLMQHIEQDAQKIERDFRRLRSDLKRLDDLSRTGETWRRRVFDAREHVEFR